MAVAITVSSRQNVGREKELRGTLALDSSYPTGGEAVDFNSVGLTQVKDLAVDPVSGYVFTVAAGSGPSSRKVLAYVTGASSGAVLAEVANTTDLSALTAVPFRVRGV